ncbi:hypothetical protein IFM89_026502 [Coptis chinensis]|uniref:DUF3381 domain-containing protein n=1 Tax=Coptis chinensis TaxID=261450 RepID=A0A835HPR3_9MAGN|nr:hypothetical protein IFM89_026502 [Coptis chinensis]
MEVIISVLPTDFNFDSACSTPFISAPASPKPFGELYFSAPTSPTRISAIYRDFNNISFVQRTSCDGSSLDWQEKIGTEPKSNDTHRCTNEDFAFDFSGQLDKTSLTADELFDGGKIRPLEIPSRSQTETQNNSPFPHRQKEERGRGRERVVDVLRGTKQKRNRDGYEDGNTASSKVCLASEFVWATNPLDIHGSNTSISFNDPACKPITDHSLTTEEVKMLCDDLPVLGKQDFKHLLKWRKQIRKASSPTELPTAKPVKEGDDKDDDKDEDDDKILNEIEELTYAMDHKKKREKKKLTKKQAKEKSHKATGMQIDALTDDYVDHELFSLSSIKGKKDLAAVDSVELNDEKGDNEGSDNEGTYEATALEEPSSDIDTDPKKPTNH